jgi:hypothetical protein
MRNRKKRLFLTAAEKRTLASTGLTVTRYSPDGERAEVRQLAPESFERRKDFACRLTDDTKASEGGG